jgi:hypothetical protein
MSETEISRLLDLMPASGRMLAKIVSQPQQPKVIGTPLPLPWNREARCIYINFDLWRHLSRPQRDLVLLRAVSWITGVKWFKPDWEKGAALAGIIWGFVELTQGDAMGVIVAGALSAIPVRQIWRNARSSQREIDADEAAIKVALRRGYSQAEAAKHLLDGIEAIAKIEGRSGFNFIELIRCQNLRSIANLSSIGVPESIKQN